MRLQPPRLRTHSEFLGFFIVALCWGSSPAWAQWVPDGIPVCSNPSAQLTPRLASDGVGGAFVVWRDVRDSATEPDLYAQRMTADGRLAAGWPPDGLPLCTAPGRQDGIFVIPDGSGGAYVSWTDRRDIFVTQQDIYLLRITAQGTRAPGWPENGLPIFRGPKSQVRPFLAPDGSGGVFVAWDHAEDVTVPNTPTEIRLLRFAPEGTVAPGWPDSGVVVCEAFGYRVVDKIAPHGSGGVLLVWTDGRNAAASAGDIYAQRVTPEGEIAAAWVPNGVPLSAAEGGQNSATLVPDGNGGALVAWTDYRNVPPDEKFPDLHTDIYAQHVLSDGTLAPGWAMNGLPLCTAQDAQANPQAVPDGAGGMVVVWTDYRDYNISASDLYAQRVLGSGSIAPGWVPNGVALTRAASFQLNPRIVSDDLGGALVAYETLLNDYDLDVQYVTGTGTIAPGWDPQGRPLCRASGLQQSPAATSDGNGGMIVAWEDGRGEGDDLDIYAQRIGTDGPVPARLSLVSVEAEPGRVALVWFGSEESASATVQRRIEGDEWFALGAPVASGTGLLSFEDHDVPAGRYAYRLVDPDGGETPLTEEVWVTVPAVAVFALEGFRPNPSRGALWMAFSLPSDAPARFEVFDVAGRRVVAEEMGPLGPGSHVVQLGSGRALSPGIYWIRLSQDGRSALVKGTVAR